jgi:DNA-binding transcriptional regulator YiaG
VNQHVQIPVNSTSAAGAMRTWQASEPVLISVILAGLGTSAVTVQDLGRSRLPLEQTTAGTVVPSEKPAGAAIGELRRLSGLTWDQLARIFSVNRRSLHFWANGKPMTSKNEEHLQRVLAVVRKIDRGSASANRTSLVGVREGGVIPLDLLTGRNYQGVLTILGPGVIRHAPTPSAKTGVEARVARTPLAPDELVGALQNRVHRESGALRAAKSVRVRSDL